jgi:prolyl oligopeptidase
MKSLSILAITGLVFTYSATAQYIYPQPKQITQKEIRFGAVIEDPYKWMENASDPDLWSWIEEQKTFTSSYLDADLSDVYATRVLEFRKIKEEQTKVTDKSMNLSFVSFEEEFFRNNEKKKTIHRWDRKTSFLKNNYKSESSLYKIQSQTVHNGDLRRLVITQKSDNKVVDILLVKFYAFVTWADDSSFYYISDLDERIGGGKPGLFKHTVGEIQSEDKLVFTGKTSNSDLVIHEVGKKFFVEADGVISAFQLGSGKVTNPLLVNGEIVEMNETPEVEATIRSFKNANYGEFHKLRLRDGARKVFLKEQDFVVEKTTKLTPDTTLIIGLKDASHVAGILHADGSLDMIEELQDGTIDYRNSDENSVTLGIETYSTPKKIYSYDFKNRALKLVSSQSYPIEVEAEKIFYEASTGQKASLWVFRKKGTSLGPKTPLILYGYGGFRSSITPAFGMYESLPWIEKGGAFAVVTLPGSLDYGNSWYEVAKVGGRINSFDSFALAAKELFKRGWTSPDSIGMMGASNGGTLVAGTLERHSEIFKAAVPIVGVMDLFNFSLFTAGKYWMEDYGNPFTAEGFAGIFPLSPYHNLKKKAYPATLVMTAEFDDRVVPMHSYKYLARLQEYNQSEAPALLYNKEWGGHARASGSSRESSRFVSAFYTFFSQQLGL